MRRWATAALAVAALAAMEEEARLTQIAYDPISLEELVRDAAVIVVARPATPARRSKKIPIAPAGHKPDAEKWPPFARELTRWQIVEVLRGDKLAAGAVVEIDEAYFDTRLRVHRDYYVKHLGKSPIFRRYAAPADDAAPERVLFLGRGEGGGLAFAADGAVESVGRKAEIVALMAKGRR